MRKINKSTILAQKYKEWLDGFTQNGEDHPPYTSSKGTYYYDIVANLLWIQKGLCAYSERKLQDCTLFHPENWVDGVYPKFEFAGQLDHFDADQKERYGWSWENFFLIDSDINMKRKRANRPSGILKPDLLNYEATTFLEYDASIHCFIPNRAQDFDTQEIIRKDISYLGLNFQPIIDIRKDYLAPLIFDVKYKVKSFEEVKSNLTQFFTAFELSHEYINQ